MKSDSIHNQIEATKKITSKTLNPTKDSDLRIDRMYYRRTRRNRSFSAVGVRVKRECVNSGKRSGPGTPLLRWKFNENEGYVSGIKTSDSSKKDRRKKKISSEGPLSARKIAAALWQLQLSQVVAAGSREHSLQKRITDWLGFEPHVGRQGSPSFCHPNAMDYHRTELKDQVQTPLFRFPQKNGFSHKVESSVPFPNHAMEKATKWDPQCSQVSGQLFQRYGNLKLLEDQQVTSVSIVSSLQAELEKAWNRINELETERKMSKKKLDHFLQKLSSEKSAWRKREHEKIRAILDDVRDELGRERKNRQRIEIVNSKLVNELAEAKLSAKRYMQDYENERKNRELMEEVCDELAKEMGEDKDEVDALKRESMKIREELDEERTMLQMAEVWREERVQMKLIDAKVTLEEKYAQLSKLQTDIEAFLRSRNSTTNVMEMKEAELLKQAVGSMNVQEMKEFSYHPPNSEDIFSVFEELHPGIMNEKEIEPCFTYSPVNHNSKIQNSIHATDSFQKGSRHKMMVKNNNGEVDDDGSGWETVSHVEDRGSSNSPEESEPSINGRGTNVSGSGTDWDENGDTGTLSTDGSDAHSVTFKKSRKKVLSISRLWRSYPNNDEKVKKFASDLTNAKLSNGRTSNLSASPDRVSSESRFIPPIFEQWNSPVSGNPHKSQCAKGNIEWLKALPKGNMKGKLAEIGVENKRIQLRHALKEKI